MMASRRLFLGTCSVLPLAGVLTPAPLLATPLLTSQPRAVGQVWGLPFWASGGAPAPAAARRQHRAPPGWHPEFS